MTFPIEITIVTNYHYISQLHSYQQNKLNVSFKLNDRQIRGGIRRSAQTMLHTGCSGSETASP